MLTLSIENKDLGRILVFSQIFCLRQEAFNAFSDNDLGSYSHLGLSGRKLLALLTAGAALGTSCRKLHCAGTVWALARWVSACFG